MHDESAIAIRAFRAALEEGIARPKILVLRMIRWYQNNISAGKDVCPQGPGKNCSTYGYNAVSRYGAVVGVIMAYWYSTHCRVDGDCDFDKDFCMGAMPWKSLFLDIPDSMPGRHPGGRKC